MVLQCCLIVRNKCVFFFQRKYSIVRCSLTVYNNIIETKNINPFPSNRCLCMSLHKGKSLKHEQSKLCVHTNGGWPGVDRKLLLWNGCDYERLEIWFLKPGTTYTQN